MKHQKKLALLALCALLLMQVVACSSSQPPVTETTETPAATDTPSSEPAETPSEAPSEEQADEPTEAPAETPEEPVADETPAEPEVNNVLFNAYGTEFLVPQIAIDGVELPLVDDTAEISLFWNWTNSYVSSPMDIYTYKYREEQTGVTVEYVCVSQDEQFQIMFASQDYNDIIKGGTTAYAGGIDKAIEDEIYVNAADYADLTPVFNAWQTTSEEYAKNCKTDGGNLCFNSIQTGREPPWCGAVMRADWLADCGLDNPVTYDDWHEALVAFRDQKGAEKPLAIEATGYDIMAYALTAGYGVAGTWYQIDGEVKYGFVEDGMKEYLTMMNQWYSEGLVDSDFPGYKNCFVDGPKYFAQGITGAWDWASHSHLDSWVAANGGQGELVALPSPVKNEGDEYHLRRYNGIHGGNCHFITTAAVERGVDELCARWIDYTYTLDCAYATTFGEENVDWTMGEDGLPHYTEYFYNHPDTKSVYVASNMDTQHTSVYIWWREFDTKTENALNAYNIWADASDGAYVLLQSGVSLTPEEAEIYASPYSDIETYVNENVPLFIRGDRSLDEWDEFVETLYQFGLQDCMDVYQAAFDRYNAR